MQPIVELPIVDSLTTGDRRLLLQEINTRLQAIELNFSILQPATGATTRTFNPTPLPVNPFNNISQVVNAYDFLDPLYARLRTAALQVREVQVMPNAIGQNQLQIDSVIARHIVANTITADKMDVNDLSAIAANIGTITAGNMTLDTSGFIRGGATAYNTGTGFWLGYDTSAYKLFIGAAAGDKLLWDGTNLTITGSLTATTGAIGGFSIGADYIRDAANSMGLASTITGGDDIRFWAGDTFANRASAPFRVLESGIIVATAAAITGTVSGRDTATIASTIDVSGIVVTDLINARLNTSAKTMLSDFSFGATDYAGALKAGTITWNTTTGALTGGSGVLVFRGGIIGAAAGIATFTLDAATGNATFSGTLSAPTGTIGGFNIGSDYIRDSVNSFGLASTVTGGDDVRFWAGATFASRATAPLRITEAGAITASSGVIGGFTMTTTNFKAGIGTGYLFDIGTTTAPYIRLGDSGVAGNGQVNIVGAGSSPHINVSSVFGTSGAVNLQINGGTNDGELYINDASGNSDIYRLGSITLRADTNLYRSAANTLKTDDSFIAVGTITGSNLSGTNTGDQTSVSGNAGTATILQTTRTIGGSNFNGSANVTSFPSPGPIGGTSASSGAFTTITASSTISAANFSGTSSGTNTGDQTNISGNAATASSVAWANVTGRNTNATRDCTISTSSPSGGNDGDIWYKY